MAQLDPGAGRPMRVLAWPAEANATGNPYNARLTAGLRALGVTVDEFSPGRLARGGHDVFHAHWPDGALSRGGMLRAPLGAGVLLALTTAARTRGTRVMWTVHNLRSHALVPPLLERAFWSRWVARVDGSIHLSASAREAALRAFPRLAGRASFIIPHPHYRDAYPPVPAQNLARRTLGLPVEARVVGFAGRVRRYKNVAALVQAFHGIADPSARLLIAGRPESAELGEQIRALASRDDRVVLRLEHVPDDDLPAVISAADVVALPYAEVLNSGVALLALSLDRPVLVPAAGAMTDLRESVGQEWVRTYEGALTAGVLADALSASVTAAPRPPAPLEAFAPAEVARATLGAYRALTSSRARG